ncbi:flavin reductase family protein [Demetria terragena]|uniref:flavin reductase family protein n=1 Tax=Demetria terragena TaxID=63959 RepID=UPI00036CEB41|nr:flavin reductase family protein [Demetria terragena]
MNDIKPRRVFRPDSPNVKAYPLLTSLVVPRPIAWVSSLGADGVGNLAPHSFFTVASTSPPIVQFTSVGIKDSLRNIEATKEFVISIATEAMADSINASSAPLPPEQDEASVLNIEMEPSEVVTVPRVRHSPASLECRLHSTIPIGDSTLVLGEVVAITVEEDALDDEHPTMEALAPMSRLGRDEWGRPPEVVRHTRP